ncbi:MULTISPECIES: hypothetical protein [unclassified Crossiella]|uniref:hypothetical protein n=1 Tax=unclassified Crossiella TaxID=2620835 RepID=UPI001FFF4D4C|nr:MULTISPECIES: hypothetical protein [unclassified Crossiella]MCK2241921.1 hypothetical protein [Crossiella sp. S99.2]MCK2255824.1 hypothetical protein [Crossiella sp. S99.1]
MFTPHPVRRSRITSSKVTWRAAMPRIAHGPASANGSQATVTEPSNTIKGQQDLFALDREPAQPVDDRVDLPVDEFPQVELTGEDDILPPEISFELFLERLDEVLRAEADANSVRS